MIYTTLGTLLEIDAWKQLTRADFSFKRWLPKEKIVLTPFYNFSVDKPLTQEKRDPLLSERVQIYIPYLWGGSPNHQSTGSSGGGRGYSPSLLLEQHYCEEKKRS